MFSGGIFSFFYYLKSVQAVIALTEVEGSKEGVSGKDPALASSDKIKKEPWPEPGDNITFDGPSVQRMKIKFPR